MKIFARSFLRRTISPLLRCLRRREGLILRFHGFTDHEHAGSENAQHKHLHVDKFAAFLEFLTKRYRIISLAELVDCLRAQKPLPPRAVVLTFDDGFRSNHALAYPLLKHYSVPAIIYLATEFVDAHQPIWTDRLDYAFHVVGKSLAELKEAKQRLKMLPQERVLLAVTELEAQLGQHLGRSDSRYVPAIYRSLDWDQVREMRASGLVEFGAHTHTHKILGRCEAATIQDELQRSKLIIERETKAPCEHFCYPNGSFGDFSEMTERFVAEAGFKSSLTTVNGWISEKQNAYLLPRLGIGNDLDIARFDLLLAGFNTMIDHAFRSSRPASLLQ
jgi:peptidoglycan/xylan/chitin deacetylase (PgdA/CDA1 family)